ncbi:hypothetical protein EC843_10185 [Buttiauxella sp. JUb87]|uniref:hypothetical protein n=1 Tax=Buttiauxella sp. JUb87 TaxID=2485129 RepID=UPI0010E936B7|nr:hypothetical protein [Buttiauxella sp. JUb87]TDN54044.1 hypothetical protein EC843_10185 [Buttiauxella sp. JUb87]
MYKLLIASALLFSNYIFAGANMDDVRYSAYFKTLSSTCILSVNGLDYLSTLKGSRNISTGSDITDALENGVNNSIGLIFFPSESKIKTETYSCEVKIVKSVPDRHDEIVTNFKVFFDGKNNRPFNDLEGYSIQDISDGTKQPIIKGISNRIIFSGEEKPEDWLTAYRNFTVSEIPVWRWTKATPQKDDLALRSQLIAAYNELINDLKKRDLTTIKKKYSIALGEYAKAGLTDDTEFFFNSIGLVSALQKGEVILNPDWKKYKVLMYQNNRMFCLGIGGASRNSPIQFFNAEGKRIFSWNPFFAMIDGKMVLVR